MCQPVSFGSSSLGNRTTNAPRFGAGVPSAGIKQLGHGLEQPRSIGSISKAVPRRGPANDRLLPPGWSVQIDIELLGGATATFSSYIQRKGGADDEIPLFHELVDLGRRWHSIILTSLTESAPADAWLSTRPGSRTCPVMMHDDQIEICEEIATELIRNQFPEWSTQSIVRVRSGGTDNAIFRIGNGLAARFPLQGADQAKTWQFLVDEARASDAFARHATVSSPIPVAIGDPGPGYPLPWSVQTWVTGTVASETRSSDSDSFARDLARLISSLRSVDTEGRRFEQGAWRRPARSRQVGPALPAKE